MLTYKGIVKKYAQARNRLDKLDKSLVKIAYKRGIDVILVLKDGIVVIPSNYKSFKKAYKVEKRDDNIQEIYIDVSVVMPEE